MAKYLLAYHGGGAAGTSEEQAAVMQAWEAWFAELGPALVDPGNPVGQVKTVTDTVTDGGGANPLTGYTLVTADDIDAAAALAKRSPILSSGGSVSVYETIEM